MTVSWASKDPNEVRSYSYSWLGRLNGAEIVTASLAVTSGTAVLSNVANTINAISATVTGGVDCEDVILTSTIVTDAGETLEEAITLKIRSSLWLNAGPSTNTKRQIVSMAYEECSLAGYEFDVTPEELFSGLRKMDAAMAEDAAQSIDLGYNFPDRFGEGDLEDYSGIPDAAVGYASLRLAQAISPNMGKTMNPEARARYSNAKIAARAMTAQRVHTGWARGTPKGAGNRWFTSYSPFMPTRRGCR